MFKRVQLKFFGIITAILIAIFIGVLSSVNIIMDALMERQTKVVLQQVASGVEYDEKTEIFTFTDPNHRQEDAPPPKDKPVKENPPTEAKTESVTAEPGTEAETKSATSAETSPVQPETDGKKPSATEEAPISGEKSTSAAEAQTSEPDKPTETMPPENRDFEERPTMPDDPWRGDWGDPGNLHDEPLEDEPPRQIWGWGGEPRWQPDDENQPDQEEYDKISPHIYGNELFSGARKLTDKTAPDHHEPIDNLPRSIGSIDFFVIMANVDGEYMSSQGNDDLTRETAQQYIDSIIKSEKNTGMTGNMSFCTEKKSNGLLLVLTDRTAELNMMNKLRRTTVTVGLVSLVFLSVAAYFVSGLIVRPLKETFEKQKQFISDASHELKTPLTVISANADVLSGELGDNKWLNYIRDQATRMNVLVNDLLSLTRLENKTKDFIRTDFDLSKAVTNAALPFECQAFENNRNFVLNVEDGIIVNGSEQHIKQMTAIFIDNAIKYSKEGGTVRVSLSREDGRTELSVYNTGPGVKESEKDKLFERFYRSDSSRNRSTGGYGLGLAIAKSIIDKHKFKIIVDNDEGRSICFRVIM